MRLPRWHESQCDPWSGDLLDVVLAALFWFVLPLARALALLPFALLRALFDRFLSYLERRVFPGGCFFVSVEVEFGTRPGAVQDRITEVQQSWRRRLERLIHEAQAAGSLDAAEDPAQLAFELDSSLLMGNTGFVLYDDPAHLERARTAIERRLSDSSRLSESGRRPSRRTRR